MSARLIALREAQGATHDKMEALLTKASDEKRDLSAEEATVFDDLQKEFDANKASIAREERVEKIKADLAKPVDIPGNNVEKVPATAKFRYGKLKAFKGESAEDDAYKSGMFFRAAIFRNQEAIDWCREHNVSITKAQGETVGSSGGYLVPVQFNQAIIDLREEYGTFRQAVSVTPMGSDSMTIPRRAGGLTAYFPGENGAITESAKSWGQVTLNAKKIAVLTRMSTELSEDAIISIADDLASEMAYAFAQTEDSCGWNGDGTSTYGGITGVRKKFADQVSGGTSTWAGAYDAASGHDTFAEIDANDLAGLMAKLPKYAEAGAKWYCSQPAWAMVFQRLMAASGGTSITDLAGGKPTRSYLGYPVVIDQTLPTSLGDLSDVSMLFFGDLSKAVTMGERRGIMVKTSEERYFEYDQIAIQATERVDINVHDLGDTSTAGPLVALIGE
jgi:HK97 family phage major capsid protein